MRGEVERDGTLALPLLELFPPFERQRVKHSAEAIGRDNRKPEVRANHAFVDFDNSLG